VKYYTSEHRDMVAVVSLSEKADVPHLRRCLYWRKCGGFAEAQTFSTSPVCTSKSRVYPTLPNLYFGYLRQKSLELFNLHNGNKITSNFSRMLAVFSTILGISMQS
jgi:hypothetical protein